MKQFNVRDETHLLGRELSVRSGKNLLTVVHEALELFEKSLEESGGEDELVDRFLSEAASTIVERTGKVLTIILHEEVPKAVEEATVELRRRQEELREQQAEELEQILKEVTPEAPEDDLEEVPF